MFLVSSCLWLVLTGHRQVLHIYSPLSRFAYLVLVLDVLRLLQYDNVVKSSAYTDHTPLFYLLKALNCLYSNMINFLGVLWWKLYLCPSHNNYPLISFHPVWCLMIFSLVDFTFTGKWLSTAFSQCSFNFSGLYYTAILTKP